MTTGLGYCHAPVTVTVYLPEYYSSLLSSSTLPSNVLLLSSTTSTDSLAPVSGYTPLTTETSIIVQTGSASIRSIRSVTISPCTSRDIPSVPSHVYSGSSATRSSHYSPLTTGKSPSGSTTIFSSAISFSAISSPTIAYNVTIPSGLPSLVTAPTLSGASSSSIGITIVTRGATGTTTALMTSISSSLRATQISDVSGGISSRVSTGSLLGSSPTFQTSSTNSNKGSIIPSVSSTARSTNSSFLPPNSSPTLQISSGTYGSQTVTSSSRRVNRVQQLHPPHLHSHRLLLSLDCRLQLQGLLRHNQTLVHSRILGTFQSYLLLQESQHQA